MKIVNFSGVPVQPFWSVPVQALAPWISRLKNSLAQVVELPAVLCQAKPLSTPVMPDAQTASNDSMFHLAPLGRLQAGSRVVPVSAKISLRVVRESDAAIRPDCAGRMVISGRMADVCAELDRMVLRAAVTDAER